MMPLSYLPILLLHTYNVLPSKSTKTLVYQTWSSSNVTKPISGRISVQETHQTTPLLSIYSYLTHVQKYLTTECTTRKKEEPSRTYLSSSYHGGRAVYTLQSRSFVNLSIITSWACILMLPSSFTRLILDCANFTEPNIIASHQKMNIEEKSYWSRSMWLKMLVCL
jgi:hypothetical protein